MKFPIRPACLSLRLPRTTRLKAIHLAQQQGISLNEFVKIAIAEKIADLDRFSSAGSPYRAPQLQPDPLPTHCTPSLNELTTFAGGGRAGLP